MFISHLAEQNEAFCCSDAHINVRLFNVFSTTEGKIDFSSDIFEPQTSQRISEYASWARGSIQSSASQRCWWRSWGQWWGRLGRLLDCSGNPDASAGRRYSDPDDLWRPHTSKHRHTQNGKESTFTHPHITCWTKNTPCIPKFLNH